MRKKIIIFLLFIISLYLPALAYDNDGPARQISGGPHRKINELALNAYLKNIWENPELAEILKKYDLKGATIKGKTVTAAGMEFITEDYKTETPYWWIVEGGYNADEPEIYNSFRHFYDPLQKDGVPYLTDHLKELDYIYKALIFRQKSTSFDAFVTDVNPQVDARDWAINGTQNNGVSPNYYCWNKGLKYMNEAFENPDEYQKELLFAKAWRSLGETMHLMADMTCVPHVRNDSHPGKAFGNFVLIGNKDENLGMLKNDPYELLTRASIVEQASEGTLDPKLKDKIEPDNCNISKLFNDVSLYTNMRFFSADTVSGKFNEQDMHNANGRRDYDSPKLEMCEFDPNTGYFTKEINGKPVRMCHRSWMGDQEWGEEVHRVRISGACVKDQASILIPVAVYSNATLVNWFIPRVEVTIDSVDKDKKEFKGTIKHTPYGAYKEMEAMKFNGDEQVCRLYVDENRKVRREDYTVKIEDGEITGSLKGTRGEIYLEDVETMRLEIEMGGILVKSEDFALDSSSPTVFKGWKLVEANISDGHKSSPADLGTSFLEVTGGKVFWSDLPTVIEPEQVYTVELSWTSEEGSYMSCNMNLYPAHLSKTGEDIDNNRATFQFKAEPDYPKIVVTFTISNVTDKVEEKNIEFIYKVQK